MDPDDPASTAKLRLAADRQPQHCGRDRLHQSLAHVLKACNHGNHIYKPCRPETKFLHFLNKQRVFSSRFVEANVDLAERLTLRWAGP